MTIPLKTMKAITKEYQVYFPGWRLIADSSWLVRESGPVLQGIVFDRASADVYRPTSFVRILTAPWHPAVMELSQQLRHPNGASNREVSLKSHEKRREEIASELRRQVVPSVDRPLVPLEILTLYERRAAPTAGQASSIASLRAYLGPEQAARKWCARFRELVDILFRDYEGLDPKLKADRLIRRAHEGHTEMEAFMTSLEHWLDEGTARQHLEEVIQAERNKLGLTD